MKFSIFATIVVSIILAQASASNPAAQLLGGRKVICDIPEFFEINVLDALGRDVEMNDTRKAMLDKCYYCKCIKGEVECFNRLDCEENLTAQEMEDWRIAHPVIIRRKSGPHQRSRNSPVTSTPSPILSSTTKLSSTTARAFSPKTTTTPTTSRPTNRISSATSVTSRAPMITSTEAPTTRSPSSAALRTTILTSGPTTVSSTAPSTTTATSTTTAKPYLVIPNSLRARKNRPKGTVVPQPTTQTPTTLAPTKYSTPKSNTTAKPSVTTRAPHFLTKTEKLAEEARMERELEEGETKPQKKREENEEETLEEEGDQPIQPGEGVMYDDMVEEDGEKNRNLTSQTTTTTTTTTETPTSNKYPEPWEFDDYVPANYTPAIDEEDLPKPTTTRKPYFPDYWTSMKYRPSTRATPTTSTTTTTTTTTPRPTSTSTTTTTTTTTTPAPTPEPTTVKQKSTARVAPKRTESRHQLDDLEVQDDSLPSDDEVVHPDLDLDIHHFGRGSSRHSRIQPKVNYLTPRISASTEILEFPRTSQSFDKETIYRLAFEACALVILYGILYTVITVFRYRSDLKEWKQEKKFTRAIARSQPPRRASNCFDTVDFA